MLRIDTVKGYQGVIEVMSRCAEVREVVTAEDVVISKGTPEEDS